MAMSDPIADMLTRIRNAGKAKSKSVDIPGSQLKTELAKILTEQGYIRHYKLFKDNKQGILRVFLKYDNRENHVILGLERVSKPSRRVYMKSKDIQPILNGMGVSVISTSKGVITDKQARKNKIGGEILCTIW